MYNSTYRTIGHGSCGFLLQGVSYLLSPLHAFYDAYCLCPSANTVKIFVLAKGNLYEFSSSLLFYADF